MPKIPKALLFITAGLGLIAVVLAALAMGGFFAPTEPVVTNSNVNAATNTNRTNANTSNTNTVNRNETVKANENSNTNGARMAAGESGITWLVEPQLLDNLELLQNPGEYDTYYRVGTLADGGSIIYAYREEMGKVVSRFRENSDGSYVLLANHSAEFYTTDPEQTLSSEVTVDQETIYSELDYPDTLTVSGLPLELFTYGLTSYTLESELEDEVVDTLEEFGITEYGTVYKLPAEVETEFANGSIVGKKYLLVLADHSIVSYADEFSFLADDNTIEGTWVKTYADFAQRSYMNGVVVSGCGVTGGNQYALELTPEALENVGSAGTDPEGDPFYTVLDGENPLLQNAYESYKLGRDFEGSTIDLLTYEEFVEATPLLIWQDAVGDYILFMDAEYAPAVECGKPVVYLYPTEPTDVTVKVGAEVRISEPAYGNGWKVSAQPNGQLTLANGSVYPNLFWEGKGHGGYPEITFGRVVARNQVGAALRSDLIKQGMNAQEIKDFLEFWMPHMPTTPYVRLSWLTTEQMNALAPLQINPQPDTIIRVFLDFAGQATANTTLQPQTLTTVPRNGFTVTEWGGLLLGQ